MKAALLTAVIALASLNQQAHAEIFLMGLQLKSWCQEEPDTYKRVYCQAFLDGYFSATLGRGDRDSEGEYCLTKFWTYDTDRVRRAVLTLLLVDAPNEYENSSHGIVFSQALVNAGMVSETCKNHPNWARYWDDRKL